MVAQAELVVYTCNASYIGGISREDCEFDASLGKVRLYPGNKI
jgi:hypothetical protein